MKDEEEYYNILRIGEIALSSQKESIASLIKKLKILLSDKDVLTYLNLLDKKKSFSGNSYVG